MLGADGVVLAEVVTARVVPARVVTARVVPAGVVETSLVGRPLEAAAAPSGRDGRASGADGSSSGVGREPFDCVGIGRQGDLVAERAAPPL